MTREEREGRTEETTKEEKEEMEGGRKRENHVQFWFVLDEGEVMPDKRDRV